MTGHHLAQLNIARARDELDSPVMAQFMANLDRINALGEASPGFVWRLQDESGNATAVRAFEDPRIIANLTVWTSVEALTAYAYRSDHVAILRRRREWFVPLDGPSLVLWWIPGGQLPTLAEAKDRLATLAALGPTPEAFTLKRPFTSPDDR